MSPLDASRYAKANQPDEIQVIKPLRTQLDARLIIYRSKGLIKFSLIRIWCGTYAPKASTGSIFQS